MSPPPHPLHVVSHETNSYSDKESKFLLVMNYYPSKLPVVENAQHDPHYP